LSNESEEEDEGDGMTIKPKLIPIKMNLIEIITYKDKAVINDNLR